jgi:hypothetical protein
VITWEIARSARPPRPPKGLTAQTTEYSNVNIDTKTSSAHRRFRRSEAWQKPVCSRSGWIYRSTTTIKATAPESARFIEIGPIGPISVRVHNTGGMGVDCHKIQQNGRTPHHPSECEPNFHRGLLGAAWYMHRRQAQENSPSVHPYLGN